MDMCLSGFSKLCFRDAVAALSKPLDFWRPNKLQVWDKDGVANESSFREGTSIADAFEVLEFDYDVIHRMSYHLEKELRTGPVKCVCELYRCPNNSNITGIRGPVYSSNHIDCQEWLQILLRGLALSANAVVTVGNEDDEFVIVVDMPLVLIPISVVASCIPLSATLREVLHANQVEFEERQGVVTITASGDTFRLAVATAIGEWLRDTANTQISQ